MSYPGGSGGGRTNNGYYSNHNSAASSAASSAYSSTNSLNQPYPPQGDLVKLVLTHMVETINMVQMVAVIIKVDMVLHHLVHMDHHQVVMEDMVLHHQVLMALHHRVHMVHLHHLEVQVHKVHQVRALDIKMVLMDNNNLILVQVIHI